MSHAPLPAAAPFWLSVALIPLVALAAWGGGMWWLIVPVYAWYLTTVLDRVLGLNEANPDPDTTTDQLFWHRAVTTTIPIPRKMRRSRQDRKKVPACAEGFTSLHVIFR